MVWRTLVALLLLAPAVCSASMIPTQLPANVSYSAGAYSVRAGGAAVAGGAVAGGATAALGGGATATIPIAWRLGELAGIAARTAIRANAVALGLQVVSDWVLPYGIRKCEQYGWCVNSTPEQAPNGKPFPKADGYWYTPKSTPAGTIDATCTLAAAEITPQAGRTWHYDGVWKYVNVASNVQVYCSVTDNSGFNWYGPMLNKAVGQCPSGFQEVSGMCNPPGYVPAGGNAPAADADWAKVPTTNVPDNVLDAVLTQTTVTLPATPDVSTAVQTVPLSSVYKDPTTGTSYRDYAYVTGNPADPQTANLQVVKTQVDPATGKPVTDPNTGNATGTVTNDPCKENPNRVGCMDKGDIPASPDLLKSEKTITITPDAGWGADTAACPADIIVPTHVRGAQSVVLSYQPVCKAADMFRPAILGVAWIVAVLIALGMGFKGGSD